MHLKKCEAPQAGAWRAVGGTFPESALGRQIDGFNLLEEDEK
jgi:hypothetical protein